jgi:hypothetical protein
VPYIGMGQEFQGLKLLDVPAGSASCEIALDPGNTIKGSVHSPDGKLLVGVSVTGLTPQDFNSTQPLRTSDFTVTGIATTRPRLLTFYHPELQLGAALMVHAADKGPLTVRLEN